MATTRGCWNELRLRAVIQRVRSASVDVGAERVAEISAGLVVLLGVGANDRAEDGERLARKIAQLRVFSDDAGRFSLTLADARGAVLAIPQFTLYGDITRGRRPDFTHAAPPERAQPLFDGFCDALRASGVQVARGRFGARRSCLDAGATGVLTKGQSVQGIVRALQIPELDPI